MLFLTQLSCALFATFIIMQLTGGSKMKDFQLLCEILLLHFISADSVHARAQVSFITTPLTMNRPLVFHTFHSLVSLACVGLWVFWGFVQHKTIMEYTQGCLEKKDLD